MSNVKPLRYVRNAGDTVGLSELRAGETIAFADIEAHDHAGVYLPVSAVKIPFYQANGTLDTISLTTEQAIPFYKANGTLDPIPLVT